MGTNGTVSSATSRRRRGITGPLLIAGGSSFCAFFGFNLLTAALPLYLEEELGLRLAEVGAVVGLSYLLSFLAYVAVGSAADRYGPVRYAVLGALVVALCVPFYGFFSALPLLAAVSLCRGLAMSAFVVAIGSFVGRLAEPGSRGFQLGVYGLFSNVALAVGPPLGLVMLGAGGSRALFFVATASAIFSAALAVPLLRSDRRNVPSVRTKTSLLDWLSGWRRLLGPAGVVAVSGVCFGAVLAFMPGYLDSRGVNNPGLFFTAEVPALLLLRVAAGTLSDRYGRAVVSGAGLVLVGISTFGLLFVSGVVGVIAAGLVAGAGWALLVPATMAWLFDRVDEARRGLASATNYTALDTGRAVGALGLGYAASHTFAGFPFVLAGLPAAVVGIALLVASAPRRGG